MTRSDDVSDADRQRQEQEQQQQQEQEQQQQQKRPTSNTSDTLTSDDITDGITENNLIN